MCSKISALLERNITIVVDMNIDDYKSLVLKAVNLESDTDTMASVAGVFSLL